MISDDIINVLLTNFDDASVKIRVEQFLETLTQDCIDDFIEINIDVIRILLKKSEVEIKKDDIVSDLSITLKIKNLFNRNVDSDVNSTNSFAFETSENEKNLNSDISDHWESKYKKNIRSILMNHNFFSDLIFISSTTKYSCSFHFAMKKISKNLNNFHISCRSRIRRLWTKFSIFSWQMIKFKKFRLR
jgi:predicted transposase YbfD/YdcC